MDNEQRTLAMRDLTDRLENLRTLAAECKEIVSDAARYIDEIANHLGDTDCIEPYELGDLRAFSKAIARCVTPMASLDGMGGTLDSYTRSLAEAMRRAQIDAISLATQ